MFMAVWSLTVISTILKIKCFFEVYPSISFKLCNAFNKVMSGHSFGEAEGNYWQSEDYYSIIGPDETAECPR
jgi:uncharacterized membrane protein